MKNANHITRSLALAAALTMVLALPGGAEPAWKKVQSRLSDQKQASDAAAGQAADAAAGADAAVSTEVPPEVDAEVKAMEAKREEEAREGAVQEVPEEGQPVTSDVVVENSGTVGLPSAGTGSGLIELGKELNEAPVKDVFKEDQFLKMIGDKPVFIYNAVDKPDPMVFPPIRTAAIYVEYLAQADELLKEAGFTKRAAGKKPAPGQVNKAKLQEAVAVLSKARGLGDARYTAQIDSRLREISTFVGLLEEPVATPIISGPGIEPTPLPQDPELPSEIVEATRGVIAGEKPFCLVGDSLLTVGDEIPSYPEVKVASIAPGGVTFTVTLAGRSKDFPVEVKGYEDIGSGGELGMHKGKGRRR